MQLTVYTVPVDGAKETTGTDSRVVTRFYYIGERFSPQRNRRKDFNFSFKP